MIELDYFRFAAFMFDAFALGVICMVVIGIWLDGRCG